MRVKELSLDRDGDHKLAFARIYQRDEWGAGSGPGSGLAATKLYRQVLQRILSNCQVRRVVDFGCGDWQFSRLINWSGIDYYGFDVVKDVIQANRDRYATDSIHFKCGDFRSGPIPPADLYILKDVLQHWPTRQIIKFLKRMAGKPMLITNTVWHRGLPINADVPAGGYRPLDLLAPPFNLANATVALEYFAGRYDYKRVLLANSPP